MLLTALAVMVFCGGIAFIGVIAGGSPDKPADTRQAAGDTDAQPLVGAVTSSPAGVAEPPDSGVTSDPAPAPATAEPTPAATSRPATSRPKPAPTSSKPKPRPTATKTKPKPRPTTEAPPAVYYKNCTAVRAAGADPIYRGQPGYGRHLDRDGDGVGCE